MSREPRAVGEVVARVRRTLERREMLSGAKRVVVAVSGGQDSLALLHALARLAPLLALELHVAHFDHRLREGSADEARFVKRQASRLRLPFVSGAAEGTERLPGRSPEESSRERRLAFLEQVAEGAGAERIATGHTMDDQAETVLMRLLTGAGSHGLGGIPPVRGPYIRPLIDVRRAETEAFCRALRLSPRHDPTNADVAFLRNAIRRDLVPLIAGRFNARAVEALARTADVLRDEDVLLDRQAAEAADLVRAGDGLKVAAEALGRLPRGLARRVVRRLVSAAGAPAVLDAASTERLLNLALRGKTGDALDLPLGLNARVEYGWLVVGRIPPQAEPPAALELEVPGETRLPPFGMSCVSWIEGAPPDAWPDGRSACVVDADRVGPPLQVRRPAPGDRFRPLGMRGFKKLSDFFTDEKVPRLERASVPLVVDARGAVVWVVGRRPDDRFRVTPRTTRFLWMTVRGEADRD